MPEETIVDSPMPQDPGNVAVAPNQDNELDAALGKMFGAQTPQPNEQTKKTPEVKVETKQEAPKTPSKSEAKVDKREVGSDKGSPESTPEDKLSPQSKDGWSVLKTNYKKAQREAQERADEVKKLKETLAEKGNLTTKEVDDLKSQIADLSKYRAMIDIQADPEFISKYDQPIQKSVSSIKEMLLGLNVSQGIVDQIDFNNTKLMDQIINHVGEHQDKFVARKLQRKVEEFIELNEKRGETLSEQKEKYNEFLESKKKENFSKEAEGEGRVTRHLQNITQGKDRNGEQKYPAIPFLNKMTPAEGANDAEISNIESHNTMVDLMTKRVHEAIKMNTPEDKAEMAVAAVASHYLTYQLKAANSKIQSLEEELKKISTVNDETVKTKAPAGARKAPKEQDVDGALSNFFANR